MDFIWMLIPAEYQTIIGVIAVAGFFLSEALSMIPAVKANGIFHGVYGLLQAVGHKARPDLIAEVKDEERPAPKPDTAEPQTFTGGRTEQADPEP